MSDPYGTYVSLLLHCNGADNSTSFPDTSLNHHTVTANGNAKISTSQGKFGGASAYFDGNGSRLTVPDHAAIYLGGGDYTVEGFLFVPALNTLGGGYFLSQANNVANNNNRQFACFANTSGLGFYWTTDGVTDQLHTFSCAIPTNQFVHVAFCRASGVLRAFLNGEQQGADFSHNVSYFNSTADFCVGSFGKYSGDGYGFLDFTGYIDELRITQSVARYTANFTPPAAPFDDPVAPTGKIVLSHANADPVFGGRHRIASTVDRLGVAGPYPVRLYHRASGRLVRATQSDADGNYAFDAIAHEAGGYFAVAHDTNGDPLNAAIADLLTPEPM